MDKSALQRGTFYMKLDGKICQCRIDHLYFYAYNIWSEVDSSRCHLENSFLGLILEHRQRVYITKERIVRHLSYIITNLTVMMIRLTRHSLDMIAISICSLMILATQILEFQN